jgi:hypothetical protein
MLCIQLSSLPTGTALKNCPSLVQTTGSLLAFSDYSFESHSRISPAYHRPKSFCSKLYNPPSSAPQPWPRSAPQNLTRSLVSLRSRSPVKWPSIRTSIHFLANLASKKPHCLSLPTKNPSRKFPTQHRTAAANCPFFYPPPPSPHQRCTLHLVR